MIQLVSQAIEVDVDEADLVAPGEAARMTDRTVQGIVTLMAIGKLPTFMLPNDQRKRPQKFTSRKAVSKLAKRKTAKRSTK
jgi:hypothetical protein